MGLFDLFRMADINAGYEEFRKTPGAFLVDVRTEEEYCGEGRIPGSINVPLNELQRISAAVPDHDAPLFVYCYSGARSRQAEARLKGMGYTGVKNIGGISGYRGKLER